MCLKQNTSYFFPGLECEELIPEQGEDVGIFFLRVTRSGIRSGVRGHLARWSLRPGRQWTGHRLEGVSQNLTAPFMTKQKLVVRHKVSA